jgi:hypothetical protein
LQNPVCVKSEVSALFDSFFLAGFECSDHVLQDGRRLDLLASTRHLDFAAADYGRLRSVGITACREGVSWVRSEPRPGEYDFSSLLPRLAAARDGMQIIWDIMHFGWPDHIDIFAADFPENFARYAGALAEFLCSNTSARLVFTPVNEMSYLSWAGGDAACMNPFAFGRGVELKVQLVAATLAAIDRIRSVAAHARFLQAEPLIQIASDPARPEQQRATERDHRAQYQALDMLRGREWRRLGGSDAQLDIVGLNFYSDNQFTPERATIYRGDPRYRPLYELLMEAWEHFGRRPILISETGAEAEERAPWLRYVADECVIALDQGCELHGVTLYPILNHPGWVDDRHCLNGLWDYADAKGARAIDAAFADELSRQAPRLLAARTNMLRRRAAATRSDQHDHA